MIKLKRADWTDRTYIYGSFVIQQSGKQWRMHLSKDRYEMVGLTKENAVIMAAIEDWEDLMEEAEIVLGKDVAAHSSLLKPFPRLRDLKEDLEQYMDKVHERDICIKSDGVLAPWMLLL